MFTTNKLAAPYFPVSIVFNKEYKLILEMTVTKVLRNNDEVKVGPVLCLSLPE